jgi:hypothetical protein
MARAVGYFRLMAQALSPNGVVLQWVSPVTELDLARVDDVLGRFHADTAELRAYVGPGPVLSDEHPIFEYLYPRLTRTAQANTDGCRGSKILAPR